MRLERKMPAEAQIKIWRKLFQRVERGLVIPVAKKHVRTLTEDCKIIFFFLLWRKLFQRVEKRLVIPVRKKHV